jgi:hypothetical protein
LPELLLLELLLLPLELLLELELELFFEPPELDLVGMTLSSSGADKPLIPLNVPAQCSWFGSSTFVARLPTTALL